MRRYSGRGDHLHFPYTDAVECVECYSKGKLEKKVNNYNCGRPREEIHYLPGGRNKITTWYDNGSAKSVEEYNGNTLINAESYNLTGAVESQVREGTGMRINRDEYGELISTESFDKGALTQKTLHYPNGSPKEINPYKNGVTEGVRKTFLPAGEPGTIENWAAGEQNGLTIVFQNGEKYAEVPYERGMKRVLRKGLETASRSLRRFRGATMCVTVPLTPILVKRLRRITTFMAGK